MLWGEIQSGKGQGGEKGSVGERQLVYEDEKRVSLSNSLTFTEHLLLYEECYLRLCRNK